MGLKFERNRNLFVLHTFIFLEVGCDIKIVEFTFHNLLSYIFLGDLMWISGLMINMSVSLSSDHQLIKALLGLRPCTILGKEILRYICLKKSH